MSTTRDSGAGTETAAQPPGIIRVDLQQEDLSIPGREVVQAPAHSSAAPT